MVHDPALADDPELVRAAGAAAALGLDNERLEAELRGRVADLEDSRRRLVDTAEVERRRLERDLHDGAQQHLVALRLTLGLARAAAQGDPAGLGRLLDRAGGELDAALAELRDLARGLHPAVLAARGLPAALASLAARAAVGVEVAAVPRERLPAAVEATVYFVVAEALTNTSKHAGAAGARVRVERLGDRVRVEVSDDGVGGADPGGSGLRGLAARVGALDGTLLVDDAPGGGTLVRAEIPLPAARPAGEGLS